MGHSNFILIISLLGIVVAYDINVTDLPQDGKSCQRGINILFSNFSCMFLNPNIFFQFEF